MSVPSSSEFNSALKLFNEVKPPNIPLPLTSEFKEPLKDVNDSQPSTKSSTVTREEASILILVNCLQPANIRSAEVKDWKLATPSPSPLIEVTELFSNIATALLSEGISALKSSKIVKPCKNLSHEVAVSKTNLVGTRYFLGTSLTSIVSVYVPSSWY